MIPGSSEDHLLGLLDINTKTLKETRGGKRPIDMPRKLWFNNIEDWLGFHS